jgi:hypothetical protein
MLGGRARKNGGHGQRRTTNLNWARGTSPDEVLSRSPLVSMFAREALGAAGEVNEALTTMDEALELNPGVMIYRLSVCRNRGELRLRKRPANTDLF